MKFRLIVPGFLLLTLAATPATVSPTGFPFADEDLAYSVNWPSGLNLGDGHLSAHHQGPNWSFELKLNASVPGFDVVDHYTSIATPDLCSLSFDRMSAHGRRKAMESETIYGGVVTRLTIDGGGKSEFPAPACLKDALTFLYFTRRELGQGRVPPAQQVLYGSLYNTTLTYAGAPVIQIGGKAEQSDKMVCTMTGAASTLKFEMYFARDAARTPLLIKVPLSMGLFSMELVR